MPATPIYALPYPAAADPADVPVDMQELAERIALVLGGALSATPPASPFEGQLWALSPSAGVVWMFRYNAGSASAYKWEFVGGPPLSAEVQTSETTASASLVDLATVGPSLTAPRAGEYDIQFSVDTYHNSVAADMLAAVKLGAAAASSNDSITYGAAAANRSSTPATRLRRVLAANDLVKLQYSTTGGGNAVFRWRRLYLVPVRLS